MPTIKEHAHLPIGVFDSGMGGLTVLRELMTALPEESFIYLGDTARLPYGTKSQETVKQYALQMASLLINLDIKLLVVACNTATTAALPYLKKKFPQLPIIGVVEPGAKAAVKITRNKKIALLATETTIRSHIYQNLIYEYDPEIEIIPQSCGLFVALAEEGSVNDDIAVAACKKYLTPLLDHAKPCDSLILGCTHFPVLIKPIQALLGNHVQIINSAKETALVVESTLINIQQRATHTAIPTKTFLVTDLPERFIRIGELFLGQPINPDHVLLVDAQHPHPPRAEYVDSKAHDNN